MFRFLLYLFETGLCLSLLYLAYWVFLRKETYFNFNRLFLVGSLALTLIIPLLHLNFFIPQGSSLEHPARDIERFQSAYEEMIRLIDADFGTEPGAEHRAGGRNLVPSLADEGGNAPELGRANVVQEKKRALSEILIIVYIGGLIYFLARFMYLVIRLYLLAKRNRVTRQEGFRMVEIEEDISPFSFFRFLFINHASFQDVELDHVLEHEKAHIRQKHSMDQLFVHMLAVFQWFNPFAWQIRKALKTTHEYIADKQVLNRGIEPIDYQALLLRQVIGYHSVELVNNFNLKPIKQRIAMMNKTRSGIQARLKAVLVIPIALLIFFLFADFTLKGSDGALFATGPGPEGLWIKQSNDHVSNTLLIQQDRISFTEGMEIRDYYLKIDAGTLNLSLREGAGGVKLKYEWKGNELDLWWKDSKASRYLKSEASNTLDHMLQGMDMNIDLPSISRYRLMDENTVFRIAYGKDPGGGSKLTFNGKPFTLVDLDELVVKEKNKLNKLDQASLTTLFLIDRSIPMVLVDQVRNELRKINSLRIAEGGYPRGDLELSPLLYHTVALPRLLPPLDAKVLDKEEVEKNGGHIHTINLSARNTSPRDVEVALANFIGEHRDGKYVLSLEYDGDIPYGQYVETVDMIFNVVYRFRDELAMHNYQLPYEQLGDQLQREMRKAFPMALSETMH